MMMLLNIMLVLDVLFDSNVVKVGIDLFMKNDRIFYIFSLVYGGLIWKCYKFCIKKFIKYELKIGFKYVIKFICDGIWYLFIIYCLFKNIYNLLGKNYKIINYRVYLNIFFCLWNV